MVHETMHSHNMHIENLPLSQVRARSDLSVFGLAVIDESECGLSICEGLCALFKFLIGGRSIIKVELE